MKPLLPPIIGLIRYSQKVLFHDSIRDVFESEYFEYRYNIFLNVTLKSFQEQSDMDFSLLLIHSDEMPDSYRERFLLLEKENPFLHNIFVPATLNSHLLEIDRSADYVSFRNGFSINFRMDNDDAAPRDFIRMLKTFLTKEYAGMAISIPKMSVVKRCAIDKYLVQERYYPSNAMGLAYVTHQDDYKIIMQLGRHDKINENHIPLLLVPGQGWLQTINGRNVYNRIDETNSTLLTEDEMSEYLKTHNYPPINLHCLKIIENQKTSILKNFLRDTWKAAYPIRSRIAVRTRLKAMYKLLFHYPTKATTNEK